MMKPKHLFFRNQIKTFYKMLVTKIMSEPSRFCGKEVLLHLLIVMPDWRTYAACRLFSLVQATGG